MLGLEATLWSNGPQPFWHQGQVFPNVGWWFRMIQRILGIALYFYYISSISDDPALESTEVGTLCLEDPQYLHGGL